MAQNHDKKWEVATRDDGLREAMALCDDIALQAWHAVAAIPTRCETEKAKAKHDGALACRNAILDLLQAE